MNSLGFTSGRPILPPDREQSGGESLLKAKPGPREALSGRFSRFAFTDFV
jgi:hypothetical protein